MMFVAQRVVPPALLSAVLVLLPFRATAAQSAIRFSLTFGPHVVGYRSAVQFDRSRNVPSDTADRFGAPVTAPRPRPVHLSVWYPAAPSNGAPMKYREYLGLYGPALHVPATTDSGRRAAEEAITQWQSLTARNPGVSFAARRDSLRAAIAREGVIPTHAISQAPADGKAYPIVIYAAGSEGPSFENDVLMEYLASQGYLAVGVPSWSASGGRFAATAASLETEARDIELALRYARELPGESMQPVALIGWSWGGLASVVVASRNQSIGALVGLDASVRYVWHDTALRNKVETDYPYATPSLFINQGSTPLSVIARLGADTTFAFYDSLRYADAYLVTVKDIRHQNFASMYNRLAGPQPDGFVSDHEVANAGYMTIATYISTFLDAYLRGSGVSKARLALKPSQLGVPDTNLTVDQKAAVRPLRTLGAFRALLGPGGWPQGPSVLSQLQRSDAGYTLDRDSLEAIGSDYLDNDQLADGLGVYLVYTKLHPSQPRAWNGLADAYAGAHDTANAVSSYREALKIAPKNARAIAGLKKMGHAPPDRQPKRTLLLSGAAKASWCPLG